MKKTDESKEIAEVFCHMFPLFTPLLLGRNHFQEPFLMTIASFESDFEDNMNTSLYQFNILLGVRFLFTRPTAGYRRLQRGSKRAIFECFEIKDYIINTFL